MKTYNYEYKNFLDFKNYVEKEKLTHKNSLIQIYSGILDKEIIQDYLEGIQNLLPYGKIIGTTTDGEILGGSIKKDSFVISISTLETTTVESCIIENHDDLSPHMVIELLEKEVITEETKCLIMFVDWRSQKTESILNLLFEKHPNILISGGKSGDNRKFNHPYLFNNKRIISEGMVVASLSGKNLQAFSNYNFNWTKIGPEMTVTKAKGNRIYKINGVSVFKIYEKYLGKTIAQQLPAAGIQFPLIIQNGSVNVARDVLHVYKDGSLLLAGNVNEGDKISFGCGNRDEILLGVYSRLKEMKEIPIESVFLYSCTARKSFLGRDVSKEIKPIAKIYKTCGFFTYGEIFHSKTENHLLNETLTFLCLSEGKKISPTTIEKTNKILQTINYNTDSAKNSYFALSHLVQTTNLELNKAHEDLIQWNENLELKVKEALVKIKTDKEVYYNLYKNIIENLGEMIVIIDKHKDIIYLNNQFIQTTGYKVEDSKFNINKILKNDDGLYGLEFQFKEFKTNLITSQGTSIPISVKEIDFIDEGAVLIIQNLQEVKELIEISTKLKELNLKKDRFINTASHELRTPLTTVKGYISMLKDGDLGTIDEIAKEYLNLILKDVEKLTTIINEVLNVSKIESKVNDELNLDKFMKELVQIGEELNKKDIEPPKNCL